MAHSTTHGNKATARRRLMAAAFLAVLGIVILAAVLRLEGLGRDSLSYDETSSLSYAQRAISHPRHWNNGMALYHAMLHEWIRLAGESEAALRFPSALFGVAAVGLLIALVRRINGWPTALAAGLMLALAWRHVFYSQEARAYSLFIMLAVLTTWLLVRLVERPGAGRLVAYGVALVALAYSHYQWVFVLVFHNLAVLFSRRRVGWGWLVLHIVAVLAYIPQIILGVLPHGRWAPYYVEQPSLFTAADTLQSFVALPPHHLIAGPLPSAPDVNVLAFYLLPVIAIAGIAAGIQPFLLRAAPHMRRILPNLTRYTAPASSRPGGPHMTWLPLLWFAAVFVLPFVIAQFGAPVFRSRYAAGALPIYCWFIGLAITALPRVWPRVVLTAFCVLLAVPAIETMKAFPMRENWRHCAQTIMANEQPGDRIVLCHFRIQKPFRAYYRGSLPISPVSRHITQDAEITAALEWTEQPKRIWLVVSHDPTRAIIPYFMRRTDYRLKRHLDPEFGAPQSSPLILLMLFERTVPAHTPTDHGTLEDRSRLSDHARPA